MNRTVQIGREATTYALRQLARRAGASPEFFAQWQIRHNPEETIVLPVAGSSKCIRFRRRADDILALRPPFPAAGASWMRPPSEKYRELQDLIVPFAAERTSKPLFALRGEDEIVCELDVLTSVLLVLSRYEETIEGDLDEHGRFPARRSMAEQHGFTHRPVIDELGLAFEQALRALLPSWNAEPRKLRVNLSHDIDKAGVPFDIRIAVSQLKHYRNPRAAVRDWLGIVVGVMPSSLRCVLQMCELSRRASLHSAVYWKASDQGPYDTGYDPRVPAIASVVQQVAEMGMENGFHPGYETYGSAEMLAAELARLRELVGARPLGGRQHFLRWSPRTWEQWEQCGLHYDSTLGFAECVGFRAGTCHPYHPWLLDRGRECNLLEVPLIAMDRTLGVYMGLRPEQSFSTVMECVRRCEIVGGVFTLLWHNTSLLDPLFGDTYQKALATLAGSRHFDCFAAWPDPYL